MRANQKIKTTPIKWKAPKIKTTKKMEKKNRFNPKIGRQLKSEDLPLLPQHFLP